MGPFHSKLPIIDEVYPKVLRSKKLPKSNYSRLLKDWESAGRPWSMGSHYWRNTFGWAPRQSSLMNDSNGLETIRPSFSNLHSGPENDRDEALCEVIELSAWL